MMDKVFVTKYIYSYKNKVAGVFYQPFVMDDEPELCMKKLVRTIQIDPAASKNFRHLELYCLGYFQDDDGIIQPDKKYLLDLDEELTKYEEDQKKGDLDHGEVK